MKNTILTLLLSCVLTGCIINQCNGIHDIIDKHHYEYTISDEIDVLDVAAILKVFAEQTKNADCKNWDCIENNKNSYMDQLKNSYISNNYPVIASESEIKFADDFLDETIECMKDSKANANYAGRYLSGASTDLIVEMINEE